jgi:hypothetical protein|tara:strand:- start:452 stop:727 length:276 start_codon:yes stop_codon:yes gene_type:complete
MGKITVKDAEALQQSGLLSDSAVAEMQSQGFVSKERNTVRRFFKTAEGQWVEPRLYFRGGKDTTKSKKMESFITEYNKLLEKYTTVRNTNK